MILPEYPLPAAAVFVPGRYPAGSITALGAGSLTVQVTATGPHDTDLQGQTLTIAITPQTTTLVNGQAAPPTNLQVGESVSLRIGQNAAGYTANQINAQSP